MNSRLAVLMSLLMMPLTSMSADISSQSKQKIFTQLSDKIQSKYVLTDKIEDIIRSLNTLKQTREFQNATSAEQVAKLLSDNIREFDKHFGVQWRDFSQQTEKKITREGWFSKLSRKNSGFNKVEILEGNVGYIDFWGFDNLNPKSRQRAEAVMAVVSDVDALIFDVRKNGGGSAEMIQLISSYFLENKTHLNSFYDRATGSMSEFWTFDKIKGAKRTDIPLYILTSDYTFSAAEEFTYNLKHLKRATIVGEATGGGANPISYFEFDNGFRASIPVSKAVNPITKTNWEGIGVQPHVAVDQEGAFNEAYKMALDAIQSSVSNAYQRKEIEKKQFELNEKADR